MVDSAREARAAAAAAGAALRLVNERAADCLIAAAERGQTQARIDVDPVPLANASGRTGRLYDDKLIEALDSAGEVALARACRIFSALGFTVATVPQVERRNEADSLVEKVTAIRVTHLELGFAAAPEVVRAPAAALMQAVALPAAYLWRARAEAARRIEAFERKALATIAAQADRGESSCRLDGRLFGGGPADARQLEALAERLRGRGFEVELLAPTASLHVSW